LLFRVLKIGSDSRFDTIRAQFFQFLGAASEWDESGGILLIDFFAMALIGFWIGTSPVLSIPWLL